MDYIVSEEELDEIYMYGFEDEDCGNSAGADKYCKWFKLKQSLEVVHTLKVDSDYTEVIFKSGKYIGKNIEILVREI